VAVFLRFHCDVQVPLCELRATDRFGLLLLLFR